MKRKANFVVPSDDRIPQWIEIPEGLRARRASHPPIAWGLPRRAIKCAEDLDGMIVNVEILEFPEDGKRGIRQGD